jgi:hypothetical protein
VVEEYWSLQQVLCGFFPVFRCRCDCFNNRLAYRHRFNVRRVMAWRIHGSLVKGEIDNRVFGCVRGRIWLVGRNEPILLDLSGNCLRDLAGCLVRFENPRAATNAEERLDLARVQNGAAGDITASRKIRLFDVPAEEALPLAKEDKKPYEQMANCLYIEWFSKTNGRIVIESSDYQIEVSAPAWTLSSDEEQAQIAASHRAIRDWLERLDQRDERDAQFNEQRPEFASDDEPALDEFGYEKLMRESDARTDKYIALLERYEDHPDREKIVAREMGWIWLEEALEADERGALRPRGEVEISPLVPNPLTEGVDWVRDAGGHIHHPLTKGAFESAMAMWHFCEDRGLLGENGDSDLREMIFQFQTTGAKIAGALDSLAYEDNHVREGGFIVAALKRALNYLHKSIAAAGKVSHKNLLAPASLDSFQADLFEVREEILNLMERFRNRDR